MCEKGALRRHQQSQAPAGGNHLWGLCVKYNKWNVFRPPLPPCLEKLNLQNLIFSLCFIFQALNYKQYKQLHASTYRQLQRQLQVQLSISTVRTFTSFKNSDLLKMTILVTYINIQNSFLKHSSLAKWFVSLPHVFSLWPSHILLSI